VIGKKWQNSERRQTQRFTYKSEFRPVLQCQKSSYRVLNISEGGLKIDVSGSPNQLYFAGAVLSGLIYFANNRQLHIEGDLVWIIGNEMGIRLRKPIHKKIIKAESAFFIEQ
jgi:hypothetical protein